MSILYVRLLLAILGPDTFVYGVIYSEENNAMNEWRCEMAWRIEQLLGMTKNPMSYRYLGDLDHC